MKLILNYRFLIFIILSVLPILLPTVFAQNEIKVINQENTKNQTSIGFECREKNFRFKVGNKIYKDKDKIYFCSNTLPDTIQIVDLEENTIPYTVNWVGNPINPSSINNYSATIDTSNFIEKKGDITVDFIDSDMIPRILSLKIRQPSSFELVNDNTSIFNYDKNDKELSPGYNTSPEKGIPWKFLENSISEPMKGKPKPSPSYYAIDLESSDATLTFQPDTLSSTSDLIDLTSIYTGMLDSTDVNGCEVFPELKVLTGKRIEREVSFIRLCTDALGCPTMPNINSILAEANLTTNQVGLHLLLDSTYQDTINYDFNGNGYLDRTPEQSYLHAIYYNLDSLNINPDILVFIVHDLGASSTGSGNQVAGRASQTAFGINSCAVDATDMVHGGVLSHEIGHACYGLSHPDDPGNPHHTPFIDNDNFMKPEFDQSKINLRQFQILIIQQ